MKKILIFILALFSLISLSACKKTSVNYQNAFLYLNLDAEFVLSTSDEGTVNLVMPMNDEAAFIYESIVLNSEKIFNVALPDAVNIIIKQASLNKILDLKKETNIFVSLKDKTDTLKLITNLNEKRARFNTKFIYKNADEIYQDLTNKLLLKNDLSLGKLKFIEKYMHIFSVSFKDALSEKNPELINKFNSYYKEKTREKFFSVNALINIEKIKKLFDSENKYLLYSVHNKNLFTSAELSNVLSLNGENLSKVYNLIKDYFSSVSNTFYYEFFFANAFLDKEKAYKKLFLEHKEILDELILHTDLFNFLTKKDLKEKETTTIKTLLKLLYEKEKTLKESFFKAHHIDKEEVEDNEELSVGFVDEKFSVCIYKSSLTLFKEKENLFITELSKYGIAFDAFFEALKTLNPEIYEAVEKITNDRLNLEKVSSASLIKGLALNIIKQQGGK